MSEVFCYQHNIDKYDSATKSLSLLQHGAYLRLIQLYYKTVGKLPNEIKSLCRMLSCQSKAERDAVAYAVAEFFTVGEDGFLRNSGAENELQRITKLSEENRRKANIKWLKEKKTRHAAAKPKHMPEGCRDDANYQLSTKNYIEDTPLPPKGEPEKINRFDEWWSVFPKQRAGSKAKARQAYLKALTRDTEENIHEGTRQYSGSDEVARGFAKGAAAWLNDDRWLNDYSANANRKASGPTAYERAVCAGVMRAEV